MKEKELSPAEIEALFCIALLNTMGVKEWSLVLERYQELKNDPKIIEAIRKQ